MPYWIARIRNEYILNIDEYGHPTHTKDESKAWKFYDFNIAMAYFDLGYTIKKCY